MVKKGKQITPSPQAWLRKGGPSKSYFWRKNYLFNPCPLFLCLAFFFHYLLWDLFDYPWTTADVKETLLNPSLNLRAHWA